MQNRLRGEFCKNKQLYQRPQRTRAAAHGRIQAGPSAGEGTPEQLWLILCKSLLSRLHGNKKANSYSVLSAAIREGRKTQ